MSLDILETRDFGSKGTGSVLQLNVSTAWGRQYDGLLNKKSYKEHMPLHVQMHSGTLMATTS